MWLVTTLAVDEALRLALSHHHAGRLAEAEAIYRAVLAQVPDHADASIFWAFWRLRRATWTRR